MAEGWARHLKSEVIEAYSAGIRPHGLNRVAVRVMLESGVDISEHGSKSLARFGDLEFDYVITVCDSASESCPVFPGRALVVHRAFDDPPRLAATAATDDDAMGVYRRVRDEIRDFVMTLPEALGDRGKARPKDSTPSSWLGLS